MRAITARHPRWVYVYQVGAPAGRGPYQIAHRRRGGGFIYFAVAAIGPSSAFTRRHQAQTPQSGLAALSATSITRIALAAARPLIRRGHRAGLSLTWNLSRPGLGARRLKRVPSSSLSSYSARNLDGDRTSSTNELGAPGDGLCR